MFELSNRNTTGSELRRHDRRYDQSNAELSDLFKQMAKGKSVDGAAFRQALAQRSVSQQAAVLDIKANYTPIETAMREMR